MQRLELRSHYFDDADARAEFKRFLVTIHRLDLSRWEAAGFWDWDGYVAYSMFEGTRIVSTVNVFTMDLVLHGNHRRVVQLSGVGTLPEFRGQGLARLLSKVALQQSDGAFLFSTDAALPVYQKLGFQQVRESAALLTVNPPQPRAGIRKLSIDHPADIDLIWSLARERAPVSETFGVLNGHLLMFHCLYTLCEKLWHIPDLDIVVCASTDGRRLTVYDILGRVVPRFHEIHPYLAHLPHDEVLFQFEPDQLDVPINERVPQENNCHVLAPFQLPAEDCVFPFVAQA